MEWHIVAKKVYPYKGDNILGIDFGTLFGDPKPSEEE